MNPKVDAYLKKSKEWQKELQELRSILLGCGLTEELKWYQPCYTFAGKNVVILHRMKESCALAFLRGALMKDAQGILIKPGENSQSGRWIKFTDVREIARMKPVLKKYIHEATEVTKAGLEVNYKQTSEFKIPAELQKKFKEKVALKSAFDALTPGRQRGYLIYFSAPKQSKTRDARIDKWTPQILKGAGMHDEYKNRQRGS